MMKLHTKPLLFSSSMVRAINAGYKSQTRRILKDQPRSSSSFVRQTFLKQALFSDGSCFNPPVIPCLNAQYNTWQKGMIPHDGYYIVKFTPAEGEALVFLRQFIDDNPETDNATGISWGWHEADDPEAIELADSSLELIQWRFPGSVIWIREKYGFFVQEDDSHIQEDAPIFWADVELSRPERLPACVWKNPRFMPKRISRHRLEVMDVKIQRLHDITEEEAVAEGILSLIAENNPLNNPFNKGRLLNGLLSGLCGGLSLGYTLVIQSY